MRREQRAQCTAAQVQFWTGLGATLLTVCARGCNVNCICPCTVREPVLFVLYAVHVRVFSGNRPWRTLRECGALYWTVALLNIADCQLIDP